MSSRNHKYKSENFYERLGVPHTASQEEIKKAFTRLSKIYHPDKNPGFKKSSEEAFKKILEAYQVLSDPKKRSNYDFRKKSQNEKNDNRYKRDTGSSSDEKTGKNDNRYKRDTGSSSDEKTGWGWGKTLIFYLAIRYLIIPIFKDDPYQNQSYTSANSKSPSREKSALSINPDGTTRLNNNVTGGWSDVHVDLNDKKNGLEKIYLSDGFLSETVNWVHGERSGRYFAFHKNSGRVRVEGQYDSDEPSGKWYIYDENGLLLEEGNVKSSCIGWDKAFGTCRITGEDFIFYGPYRSFAYKYTQSGKQTTFLRESGNKAYVPIDDGVSRSNMSMSSYKEVWTGAYSMYDANGVIKKLGTYDENGRILNYTEWISESIKITEIENGVKKIFNPDGSLLRQGGFNPYTGELEGSGYEIHKKPILSSLDGIWNYAEPSEEMKANPDYRWTPSFPGPYFQGYLSEGVFKDGKKHGNWTTYHYRYGLLWVEAWDNPGFGKYSKTPKLYKWFAGEGGWLDGQENGLHTIVRLDQNLSRVKPVTCGKCSIEDLFLPDIFGTAWPKEEIVVSMNYLNGQPHGKVSADYGSSSKEWFFDNGQKVSEETN